MYYVHPAKKKEAKVDSIRQQIRQAELTESD